jgi:hypothetical protein
MLLPIPFSRSKNDPKVIKSGPGTLTSLDHLAKFLGWFSIGLGVTELVAPGNLGRMLGMDSPYARTRLRSYGVREVGAGLLTLSVDKKVGLYARVIGDALDVATLVGLVKRSNPNRGTAKFALAAVLGITALDVFAAKALKSRTSRPSEPRRYSDRSGFPGGLKSVRGKNSAPSPIRTAAHI